jgi:hypothetical protein
MGLCEALAMERLAADLRDANLSSPEPLFQNNKL